MGRERCESVEFVTRTWIEYAGSQDAQMLFKLIQGVVNGDKEKVKHIFNVFKRLKNIQTVLAGSQEDR